MRSLRTKLVVKILPMVILAVLISVVAIFFKFSAITEDITNVLVEDKIMSSNSMLKTFLHEEFGNISLNEKYELVDERHISIEDEFGIIDEFGSNMNVSVTLFARKNNEFVRVLTNIKDESGARQVGTRLDSSGEAYRSISTGNTFTGSAEILGKEYVTGYAPMYNSSRELIGAYFVGMPIKQVNDIMATGVISAIKTIIILSVIIIILSGGAVILLSNSIVRPIVKVNVAAEKIAKGDFDVELNVDLKDEVGNLAKTFKITVDRLLNYQAYIDEISAALMDLSKGDLQTELKKEYVGQFEKLKVNMVNFQNNLNNTLVQISQTSAQVECGANQSAIGAQSLSQGVTQQASAIDELSAAIDDVTKIIKENAENAQSALNKADYAQNEIVASNDEMNEMVSAMDLISKKSSEISNIIKTIDDIAFQTNILALNAAVEAARAGAAGKGFGVVADEVRNLASKSAAAAKNTAVLIEETIAAVNNGTSIASKTAESLVKSANITKDAVDLINQIADASKEQATTIIQINQGIDQISSVVQTNAATAEQSAAASEELSSQATILQSLISKFKLKNEEYVAENKPSSVSSREKATNVPTLDSRDSKY